MKLGFQPQAWADYLYWQSQDAGMVQRINALLTDMRRSPFRGIGKPEPLGENWTGFWARRITEEHRLVYRVFGKGADQQIEFAQCRYHYIR